MLAMPTSAQSLCLAPTYQRLPGSSPTSSLPSPGRCPAAARTATRSVSSVRIAAAVALPSRIVAGTSTSVPETAPGPAARPYPRQVWAPPRARSTRRRTQMSERDQTPYASGSRSVQDETTIQVPDDSWREQTTPGMTPVRDDGPGGLFPGAGHGATAAGPGMPGWSAGDGTTTSPRYSTKPVAIRRGDSFAALLLLLAGIAGGVSLLLDWLPRPDTQGLDLLRRGLDTVSGDGVAAVFRTGLWQPMFVLVGSGVLSLIGLLLLVP